MNIREKALLRLCCPLGRGDCRPLTGTQYAVLAQRMTEAPWENLNEGLTPAHISSLGYDEVTSRRIVELLDWDEEEYLGRCPGLRVLTRISPGFPARLRRLGSRCPGALFCLGDTGLFSRPAVALVGSRQIREENRQFAAAIGELAAREGFVLVSGGAYGADRIAQSACLRAGGQVICVVPDALQSYRENPDILYCSDEGYELPFSACRALRRNGLIHALGEKTFVAQAELERGGTWSGTADNLRSGLSAVFICNDRSPGALALGQMGGTLLNSLPDSIASLEEDQLSIFNDI